MDVPAPPPSGPSSKDQDHRSSENYHPPSLPLTQKNCAPCGRTESGEVTTPYSSSEAQSHLDRFFPRPTLSRDGATNANETTTDDHSDVVDGHWYLTHDGTRIRKNYTVRNFTAGIHFFDEIARVAEEEGHHPDLRLEGYRNVSVEIWTHFIGGLSENDFILAAKIDRVPVRLAKVRAKPVEDGE